MSEAEKQEGQKTVVAFITGLLIGGLLVWVFSSSPEDTPTDITDDAQTEESSTVDTKESVTADTNANIVGDAKKPVVMTGDGEIKVENQKAGGTVVLGTLELPTKSGWVVVRDYMDGVPGNVLGAARYNTEEGLIPTQVELLRNTTKDSSYQVVFFSESTNTTFSMKDDVLIDGVSATFKAN